PSVIIDRDEAAQKLSKLKGMPKFDLIKQKLADKSKHFVWLARHITPNVQQEIMNMGIPGIHFQKDYKRIYTHGNLFSHIIGCCDIDGCGICGIEKRFNDQLTVLDFPAKALPLSLDLRLQSIVHEELKKAVDYYKAIGGNAILMKTNGEILAIVSLPDFDSNDLKNTDSANMFNRNTLGVFEQGSVLKILNIAIALEEKTAKLNSIFDATAPIKLGRHLISDYRGKNRSLSFAEAFVFSSNIAAVKIAQTFGSRVQKAYMKKFGLLEKPKLEISEIGAPLFPTSWSEATAMTVSYGYGISISPLQLITIITSIVSGGLKVTPTLLFKNNETDIERIRYVSQKTSQAVRDLMRATVLFGTAKKASINGVPIIGKTGTAYKTNGKGYGNNSNRARITTFIGGFPKDNPQYMLLISLDDPKPSENSFGFATAGWNVAPTAKNIFSRIVPMLLDDKYTEELPLQSTKYITIK
ncbi:MAG: penicillin-binding protein 2, partial [Holosporales bacterium]|nr:penicillin-binding protein 2 [Holosporales bacterium]